MTLIPGYRPELDFTVDYSSTSSIKNSYAKIESAYTVTAVDSPTGDGTRMMLAVVPDDATGVTSNPRMQAQPAPNIRKGDEFWWTFDIVFPADFPVVGRWDGYIQVAQLFGRPFGGGAPFTLTSRSDGPHDTLDQLRWAPNRDNPHIDGLIWAHPITRGVKHRYAIRMKVTDSRDTGYVEIWYDGDGDGYRQQTLYGGVTRLPVVLWGSVNNVGPNRTDAQLYRRAGEYDTVTLFHGNHTIRGELPPETLFHGGATMPIEVPTFDTTTVYTIEEIDQKFTDHQHSESVGEPGPPGQDGIDGAPGKDGIDGIDGKDGAPGEQGPPGRDGTSTPSNGSVPDASVLEQLMGVRFFDLLGDNDDDRTRAMNALNEQHGPTIFLSDRHHQTSVPIEAWSGANVVAASGATPAREYSQGPTWKCTGPATIVFAPRGQTEQSYPGDGSVRDMTFSGIQFDGANSGTLIAPAASYPGKTLWYVDFHNCGFKNYRNVHHGWGTGLTFTGTTHMQGVIDTPVKLGGSENRFGRAQSFMDSTGWGNTEKPMLHADSLSKSFINDVMPTARGRSWQLTISGSSHAVCAAECSFDSQDSDPVHGANVKILGGEGNRLINNTFKGGMADPSDGGRHNTGRPDTPEERRSQNGGFVHVEGGSVLIEGNTFLNQGKIVPADTPLVWVGPNVGNAAVKVGVNMFPGFSGVISVARAEQVVVTDSSMRVVTR